jgi:hypothetical protein
MSRRRLPVLPSQVIWRVLLWSPLVALLFGPLMVETWLHLAVLQNDYELNELNRELTETDERIDALKTTIAELETLERINAQIPNLGLVEPQPEQIVTVRISPDGRFLDGAAYYNLAGLTRVERETGGTAFQE